jgi:hypothetical protein
LKGLTKLTLTVEIFRGCGGHHCCIGTCLVACFSALVSGWTLYLSILCVCVHVCFLFVITGKTTRLGSLWWLGHRLMVHAYSSQSQLVLGKVSVCANRHMLRWADWPEKWTLWEVELLCVLLGYESRNRSAAKRARGSDEAKWRPVLLLLLQASGHWSCRKLRKT